jgi:N-acetylglucosamine kinase-like BadF-type ATPase
VLGVDGGGSKTHALVLDETGRALGFGQAGTGNHQADGLAAAVAEIERAVSAAFAEARLESETLHRACFCLAGADLPEDYTMLQSAMESLGVAHTVAIKNDSFAALRSGLTRPWGVAVICGTGINAAGRAPDGREFVFPALGSYSGDWGGGAGLAEEMVRLMMRAWDGRGRPTLLTELILRALALPSPEALLRALYLEQMDSRRLLDLVPLLFQAAEAGDAVARDLVVRQGTEMGVMVNALIRRLDLATLPVEVVLAGSVFKGQGTLLAHTVAQVVRPVAPQARLVRPRYEPVAGAALLALESLSGPADQAVMTQLDQTLPGRCVLSPAEQRGTVMEKSS